MEGKDESEVELFFCAGGVQVTLGLVGEGKRLLGSVVGGHV